jgi:hypothetical protein
MSEVSARGKAGPLFVLVVLVLVATLVVEGFLLLWPTFSRGGRPVRPEEAEAAIAAGPDRIESFGQAEAPIKIEFYAPLVLEWHQKTIGLLRKYDQQHPGRIRVTLMPMGRSECDTEMQKRGYTCAVIFVNGEDEFTLPSGKKVVLQKKPNTADSFYNSEDVIAVVEQLWKARGKQRRGGREG